MICIERNNTNPYFNIAAEEYALKSFDEDVFMLWINDPSIIVGKHQNALAEINHPYIKKNKIPVVRRISGGGTVFHDHGNLNFTFIKSGEKDKLVDFEKFTTPIVEILNDMGVPARFEGKNDLRVHGLKISGNAEHVFKNRVLHHGTLLFDSQLDRLNEAIKVKEGQYKDKAVKSNRSIVTNIIDHLPERYTGMSIDDFKERIEKALMEKYHDVRCIQFSKQDIENINKLVKERYETWKWNYGYSPKFEIEHHFQLNKEDIHLSFKVKNGLVEEVVEKFHVGLFDWKSLIGKEYSENSLPEEIIKLLDLPDAQIESIRSLMF